MERVDGDDRTISVLRAALQDREQELVDKERQLERYARDLRDTYKRERARGQQLEASYVATVRALTNAVEARDAYTGKHAERVAAFGLELARQIDPELARNPQIEFGFLLHDVGKVAVPDGILHKPDHLLDEERALMRRHPVVGYEILQGIEFLAEAAQIVRHHHERWDGGGYPDCLSGEDIPLAARVFSVVDTLDAMPTDRPYRRAVSVARARSEIAAKAGSQFDPAVVAQLARISDETLERIRTEVA